MLSLLTSNKNGYDSKARISTNSAGNNFVHRHTNQYPTSSVIPNIPCTLNVPLVVAFPPTDCTLHAYVPASFSSTVSMRSVPSFCSFIRAVSTELPSLVQDHSTVMAGSAWTPQGRSFGRPLMADIWLGSGFVITVLTGRKRNKTFYGG